MEVMRRFVSDSFLFAIAITESSEASGRGLHIILFLLPIILFPNSNFFSHYSLDVYLLFS